MSRSLVLGLIVAVGAVMGSATDASAQATGNTFFIEVDSSVSGHFDAILTFNGTTTPLIPGFLSTSNGITSLVADDLSIGAGAYTEWTITIFGLNFSNVNAPVIVGSGYEGQFTATTNVIRPFFGGSVLEGQGSGNAGDNFTFYSIP